MSRPLYSPVHIGLATLLGGPFAGGLLAALTVDRLGRRGIALAIAPGSLVLALGAVSVGEALAAPYGVLPILWAALAGGLAWRGLGGAVARAGDEGAQVGSIYGMGVCVLLGVAVMMAWAAAT